MERFRQYGEKLLEGNTQLTVAALYTLGQAPLLFDIIVLTLLQSDIKLISMTKRERR